MAQHGPRQFANVVRKDVVAPGNERCRVRGIPGRDPGEKGSGIHAYDLTGFRFEGNEVTDVRDGLYLQNASSGTLRGNVARDVRYGLHYMFSDDNVFEENTFENGAAGTAIMYSERIVFRRNRFLRNRGFASVGLLFQTCTDVLAEDNLIADKSAQEFIVVMPFGHAVPHGSPPELQQTNTDKFEAYLLGDVLPLVESKYRVLTTRRERAIAGYSMGGGQAITIGLRNLDKFSAIGSFSGAAPSDRDAPVVEILSQADAVNDALDLFWIGCGLLVGHWLGME